MLVVEVAISLVVVVSLVAGVTAKAAAESAVVVEEGTTLAIVEVNSSGCVTVERVKVRRSRSDKDNENGKSTES